MFNFPRQIRLIKARLTKPKAGFVLVQFTLMLVAMLGFLGYAIYYGQIGLLQNELQKNTNMAALAGAASLYDGSTQGAPVLSKARGQLASMNAFNRALNASAVLTGMNAQIASIVVQNNGVQLTTQGTIPTPFLALVGINQVQVNADANAAPAKEVITNIGPIDATTPYRTLALRQPVLDGPGPDVHIVPINVQGYIPEVCAGKNDCYPVNNASKPVNGGMVEDRLVGTQTTRLLFGEQFIDMGATGPNYNADIKKGSQIKISHDGVDDVLEAGNRYLYLVPPASVNFGLIEVYHHSVLCDQACSYPTGFLPMS